MTRNAAKKKGPPELRSLEAAANRLRGVNMHLSIFKARGLDGIADPMTAIEESIREIDAFTEASLAGRGGPRRPI